MHGELKTYGVYGFEMLLEEYPDARLYSRIMGEEVDVFVPVERDAISDVIGDLEDWPFHTQIVVTQTVPVEHIIIERIEPEKWSGPN